MNRIALTNDNGWFDHDKAVVYEEKIIFSNGNYLSVNTSSEWDHHYLLFTHGGKWVMNRWSQRQGVAETYELVDAHEAARWLVVNDCVDKLDRLPIAEMEAMQKRIADMEV
jgi:hypothetical protein